MTGLNGFRHLPGYLAPSQQAELASQIRALLAAAPLYTPTMPRTGKPFSVRMRNCGPLGWVSDKVGGYRVALMETARLVAANLGATARTMELLAPLLPPLAVPGSAAA